VTETSPEISIVIPTYNERENIASVVRDIYSVALERGYSIEVIIVDDNSPDGTGQEAELLAHQFPVRVIHREAKLGLGSAVAEGFAAARGRIWGVMDGDRSHPAETLPDLIEPIRQGRCEIALASRYAPGGSVEYWPWHRWILSRAATLLARLFVRVRDPLSGFIFFERSVVEAVPLTVRGYKIALEILIKGRYRSVLEVPYTFRNREVGRSKLGWSEYVNYLQSLFSHTIYLFRHRREVWGRRTAVSRSAQDKKTGAEPEGQRLWGPCPLCGADNSAFLFVKNTYRYARCRRCGLIFVNPMPTRGELEAIYQDPLYFANRNEWKYGYNDYFAERGFHTALFERRVRECEKALGVESGRGLRLLEVGCAAGFLLEVARERGWEVAGVEISEPAASFARERLGDVVRTGTLEDARFENDSFDCVVMLDVVEHVPDPVGLLREAARVLRPGGVLLLSAPNARSISARLAGRYWFHFKRDHVVLFTEATLLRALDAAGLDCFHLGRNGKMVSLNYLFARLKTYAPALGKLLLATVGRLGFADRLFYDSWTGEMLAFSRKRPERRDSPLPPPDEVYARFRAHWWPPTALWRTAEYFYIARIEARPPVLDLGSGDGFFARQALLGNLRRNLVAVDRKNDNLRVQKIEETNDRLACADARALPFRSETFGLVLANCTLEHIEGVGRVLGEAGRVLKRGGKLVFTVPSEHFDRLLFFSQLFSTLGLRGLARAYAKFVNRTFGHYNILAPERWRELLADAGLRVERSEYFMPEALARMWDRHLWLGLPWALIGRKTQRATYRRPRPRPLPEPLRDLFVNPCAEGAGAIYFCVKD